ncbi:MAG: class II aldolase/adducin family protein, partial [Gemmatimonadetes bacterium]|nr:class II aldolase/adducin family protein [Gemmatimonadota bacterium]
MTDAEGTIQFSYDLQPLQASIAGEDLLRPLFAWRTILRRLQLIGQTPERYGGLGYGNLSFRDPDHGQEFVITASQTSGAADFSVDDLTRIQSCHLERFWVTALGSRAPSSETLTHAMLYAADTRLQWVFHVHCPEIWQRTEHLGLPVTEEDVGYGSLAMASAVAALLQAHQSRPL